MKMGSRPLRSGWMPKEAKREALERKREKREREKKRWTWDVRSRTRGCHFL